MDNWSIRLKSLLAIILVFNSCEEKPKKVGIAHLTWEKDEVNFCDAYPFEWDSILIVLPYTRFSALKFKLRLRNISTIKKELKDMQYIDWKSYLLFIKGSRDVIAYAPISRQYDFNFDSYKKPGFKFISRSNCMISLRKDTSEYEKKKVPFFIMELQSK